MRITLPLAAAAAAAFLAAVVWAQGNDTPSSSTTQASPHGVMVGVGTTDETTIGSSGGQQVANQSARATRPEPSSQPGNNGLFCADIREATARARCESRRPGNEGSAR